MPLTGLTSKTVKIAVSHHRCGNLDQAEQIYQQILTTSPKNTTALHLLGCIHLQRGEHREAKRFIGQAIKINPSVAEFYNNMGTTLRAQGKLKTAASNYKRAVTLNPKYAQAHYNLGIVLLDQKQFKRAETSFRAGLKIESSHHGLWNNLGRALHEQKRDPEAEACYRETLRLKPDLTEARVNLGYALQCQDKFAEAAETYEASIKAQDDPPHIRLHLGEVLVRLGRLADAANAYEQQIILTPHAAEAHNGLAETRRRQGRLDEAVDAYRKTVQLAPTHPTAHLTLADALRDRGDIAQAENSYRDALRLKPTFPEALNNLGYVLMMQGRVEEALACFQQALQINPGFALAQSNLAFFQNYAPGLGSPAITREYRRWAQKHTRPAKNTKPFRNDTNPDRRLRIGYLSPGFRAHPVGRYFDAFLSRHNPSEVEIFCYAQVSKPDEVTNRLRSHTEHWWSTVGKTDTEVAEKIRHDRIDILVNSANHTSGHRLGVLAQKPAPIQVMWMGGPPVTSGLDTVDYILTDRFQSPPGDEQPLIEKLYRMPDGYVCYKPPSPPCPLGEPPALKNGYITFGCFNALSKINTGVIGLWSNLLGRLPTARLVLKTQSLKERGVKEYLLNEFARHGIDAGRIDLYPPSPHLELLAFYNRVDISLDPFPYSGGISTLESLWMGVPVITLCPKQGHAVRHSASHLSNTGLSEFIAHTAQDYVEKALSLAQDLNRLASTRATLRNQLIASPICDADRFTANLEQAYRHMWLCWCETVKTAAA